MKNWKWLTVTAVVTAIYIAFVLLVGFEGIAGPVINVARIALAVAVLVLFLPTLPLIFQSIPAPRRDYLLAGIILTWSSAILFAVWNEAGRQFGVDTSIFRSPIAGFFSLLLVLGGVFHLLAPDTEGRKRRWVAVAVGVVAGLLIGVVAPLFR